MPSRTLLTSASLADAALLTHTEQGREWPLLVWAPGPGVRMVSSAVLGGGIGERGWVLNAQVPPGYDRLDPVDHLRELAAGRGSPGTINIIVSCPVPLTDAALVNAVATATEAKVQALVELGADASGTPTDAVCVAAPTPEGTEAEPFAGPRSRWGARLARAASQQRAVPGRTPRPGRLRAFTVVSPRAVSGPLHRGCGK
uniref:Adenosylcobinamide amidohydrolase n=1 Tax=Streptomyces venezuelae TaxID=54571 RepID=Q8RMC2_STRVZ|nr:unknown [Streptomyces venezuelae]